MGSKSDYAENLVLDTLLRNSGAVYVALYTVAPTDAGGGTQVSGNNYARVAATFAAASGGATSNSAAVTFPTPSADWGTVVAWGIFDASTNGNLLYWSALAANKTIQSGDGVQFAIGDLDVSED